MSDKPNSKTEFETPEFSNYKCYKMGGILYVPHYVKPGVYVAPAIKVVGPNGRSEFTTRYFYRHELLSMGAVETKESLWKTYARDEA
jgi:hypothetical protein